MNSYTSGLLAEIIAMAVLTLKGYRVLGWRVKTPFGEMDIVARTGAVLVVVEVKKRGTAFAAASAISGQQQQRLLKAAQAYAQRLRWAPDTIRLDAFLFSGQNWWPRHIQNAF